jgi:anti-anti-sigma regulatory factor
MSEDDMAKVKESNAASDSVDWIKGSNDAAEAETISGDIVLEGALGIAEAESMHQQLSAILDAGVDISIATENLSRVDAAGAQLLYAFVKEAKTRSLTLTWESVSDALMETVMVLGLSDGMAFKTSDA